MTDDFPRSLLRLVKQPDQLNELSLWRAMPERDRRSAIEFLLESDNPDVRSFLVKSIARQNNFRTRTVNSWDHRKLAAAGARILLRESEPILELLRVLHLSGRRRMMSAYLDSIGIPNDNGFVAPEEASESDVNDRLRAAREVLDAFPDVDVAIYLMTRELMGFTHSVPADRLMELFVESDEETERNDPRPVDSDLESESGPEAGSSDVDRFTKLDKLLILAAVDVAQETEGALTVDELDDLIGELIELNSSRHRSFFHAGFLEAIFGRPVREKLPATNESRMGWYWAGRIQGLARESRWDEIVSCYDGEASVAALGIGGEGASHAAARFVSEALFRSHRPVDAVAFLDAAAVARNPQLVFLLEREGTRLLNDEDLAPARAVFDLLGDAIALLESEGIDTSVQPFLLIRRRRAHCYRRLGEFHRARELLDRLLDEDPDLNTRSMVLADLGIIKAGYRGLTDVRLPRAEDERDAVLAALERGTPFFAIGAEAEVRGAAHSRYCLGVVSMLREDYGAAADHFESALSIFEGSGEHYDRRGFLADVRLYLALALCLDCREDRMAQAIGWIETAARDSTVVPDYLIEPAVESLGAAATEYGRRAADAIVAAGGPDAIDPLVRAGVRSVEVARALICRAADGVRSRGEQAEDYRAALPMLLRSSHLDEASEVLDELAQMARGGVGRDEFRGILTDSGLHEPAWDSDEALWELIRCFEAEGAYLEAARKLIPEVHRVISEGGFGAPEDARAVVEHIRAYGNGNGLDQLKEELEGLDSRIDGVIALEGESLATEPIEESLSVTIYLVGGDERQSKHDEWLRDRVAERDPAVRVEFLRPGWSGNWSAALDEAVRTLRKVDGVVVMKFMRTVFGRRLRKEIEVPWRGCHGAGRNAMLNSILLTAKEARRHLRAQQGVTV